MKAILFDFGGTLDSAGVAWPQRFFAIYRALGVDPGWDAFLRAFYRSDDALAQRHRLAGLDLRETAALQAAGVLEALGADARLAEAVAERFSAESRAHFASARPSLERLARRYRLGVVSNFYGNLRGLMAAEGWAPLFGSIVDSGEVGAIKPEAAIFGHALRALGAAPDEALMVGDSLARDIRGAESLGMPHAWIASAAPATPCCPIGLRIGSVLDLEGLLDEVPA